jgi:glutaredoxin
MLIKSLVNWMKWLVNLRGSPQYPQIFINGKHIGGFDDLKKLNESGKLDVLLKG